MSPAPPDDAPPGRDAPGDAPATSAAPAKFSMPATAIEIPRQSVANGGSGNALMVGTWLGEFELLGVVGEGGFGIVYRAWDHSLNRQVAIKEYMPAVIAMRGHGAQVNVRSDRQAEAFDAGLRSFVNEARMLAQFDHPALVKVYRFWEANGSAYMVMPFYEGITLRDHLKALGTPPDEDTILGWLGPVADALAVIHAQQWYHRDIAPDNVMLLPGSSRPLLLDFGAARRVIGDMTQALTVIMKPGYAPIEQFGEIPGMHQGAWTDLYALAAVAHFAMRGVTPPASVVRLLNDSYQPLAEVAAGQYSDGFLRAIDHALAVRPQDRPQTVAAFKAELGLDAKPGRHADIDYPASHPARQPPPPGPKPPVHDTDSTVGAAAALAAPVAVPVAAPAAPAVPARPAAAAAPEPVASITPAPAAAPVVTDISAATSRRGLLVNAVGGAVVLGAVALTWWLLRPAPQAVQTAQAPALPVAQPSAPAPVAASAAPAASKPAPALAGALDVEAEFERVLQAQTRGWGLDLTLGKPKLRVDRDVLTFSLRSLQDGQLTVYLLGPDKKLQRLYPNSAAQTTRITKGVLQKLPQDKLSFPVENPTGTSKLLVIVSRWPRMAPALSARDDGGFLAFNTDAAAAAAAQASQASAGPNAPPLLAGRAICPAGNDCRDEFGAATVSFEVLP